MNPLEVVKEASKTAFNVAEHAVRTASFFATDEKKNERINICKACSEYILEKDKCSKCGCAMQRKASLEAAKCPINKW